MPTLVIIAPHPDDAVLGAGGLIQRALAHHWSVHVLHMTHGDGNRTSQWRQYRTARPLTALRQGIARRTEALVALQGLGVPAAQCVFLGFPDGGLGQLAMMPYTSPWTHCQRDPYQDSPSMGNAYTANTWAQSVFRYLTDIHPALIIYPNAEDTHPDHRATSRLVAQLTCGIPALTYRIHGRSPSPAPIPFSLTPTEQQAKSQAILTHISQAAVTGWWLNTFAQSVEGFYPALASLPVFGKSPASAFISLH